MSVIPTLSTTQFFIDAEENRRRRAYAQAGHLVVAAIEEGEAFGTYLIQAADFDPYGRPTWDGRLWGQIDRIMPEVAIAGLTSAMLYKDPSTTREQVSNVAEVQAGSGDLYTMLHPWEVHLAGGYDALNELFV